MKIRVKAHEKSTRRTAPWVAAGTLAAYTVLGSRMAAPARAGEVSLDSESGPALQGQQPVRRFDIPADSLETVLGAFQSVSGVTITLPAGSIKGLASPGVSGDYTAERALQRLLEGTGVAYRFTAPDAAVLQIRLRESVEVTAVARSVSSPKYTEPLRDIPADDHGRPARGHRGAERDHAARRAAQRPRASRSRPGKAACPRATT